MCVCVRVRACACMYTPAALAVRPRHFMRSSKRVHHADANADEPLPLAYPPEALSPPQQPDLVAASRALLNGLSREEVRASTCARRCATCMRTRACVCAPIHSTQAITSVLRRVRARACAGVCGFLLCRVVGRVLVV
jgi:hypothetical protein